MKFLISKTKHQRDPSRFSGDDLYYYNFKIEKPTTFCCEELGKNWELIREYCLTSDVNTKVDHLQLYTDPEWGQSIDLNFCPSCGESVTFEEK